MHAIAANSPKIKLRTRKAKELEVTKVFQVLVSRALNAALKKILVDIDAFP